MGLQRYGDEDMRGLLAMCLVLLMFVVLVVRAVAVAQPPERRALLIASLAAVTGNVAGGLVSFDVTPTAMASWLLMGVGVALSAPPRLPPERHATDWQPARWALALLVSVALAVAVWRANGRPLLADVAARTAHLQARRGDWARAIGAGEQAVVFWPSEPAYHLLLSQLYWQQAESEPESASMWLPRAEAALSTARAERPGDPTVWMHTAQFYAASARRFGANTRGLADEAYRQAVALAPNYATIYTDWGRTRLEDGDVGQAAVLLRRAVVLDASSAEAYLHLGAAELALGRVEVALADYQEAIRLLPRSAQAYAGLATCYLELGRWEEAQLAAEAALQRDAANSLAIAVLAQLSGSP
jgi:tetratricopeptide (TPR) repeat protein